MALEDGIPPYRNSYFCLTYNKEKFEIQKRLRVWRPALHSIKRRPDMSSELHLLLSVRSWSNFPISRCFSFLIKIRLSGCQSHFIVIVLQTSNGSFWSGRIRTRWRRMGQNWCSIIQLCKSYSFFCLFHKTSHCYVATACFFFFFNTDHSRAPDLFGALWVPKLLPKYDALTTTAYSGQRPFLNTVPSCLSSLFSFWPTPLDRC